MSAKNGAPPPSPLHQPGKTFLTTIVGNHWATGGLWANSTPDYNLSFVPARGEYKIADHT